MARRSESIPEMLIKCPWWFGTIVSALIYFGGPLAAQVMTASGDKNVAVFAGLVAGLSKPVAAMCLAAAGISALGSIWRWITGKARLGRQTGIDSIRNLSWREFELLVADAYRAKGYRVFENRELGPDGGVDLRLEKDGVTTLLQCKQWQMQSVGVKVVRELYGLVVHHGAEEGQVVCVGTYTPEAEAFVRGKPIRLITGRDLERLIAEAQGRRLEAKTEDVPVCPACGTPMVRRTARRGPNAGGQFWGCSNYPRCRETKSG